MGYLRVGWADKKAGTSSAEPHLDPMLVGTGRFRLGQHRDTGRVVEGHSGGGEGAFLGREREEQGEEHVWDGIVIHTMMRTCVQAPVHMMHE